MLALTFLGFSEHYTFLTFLIQLLTPHPNKIHLYGKGSQSPEHFSIAKTSVFLLSCWNLVFKSLLIVLVCRSDIPKSLSCLVIFTLNLSSNHLMINPFPSSFSPHLLSLGRSLFSIFQAHLFEQQGSCQLL